MNVGNSALAQLLAGMADGGVRAAAPVTAERLSRWLGWADAIALSAALGGPAAGMPSSARLAAGEGEWAECSRMRAGVVAAIAAGGGMSRDGGPAHGEGGAVPAEYAPYRMHYLARQQAMETAIAPLRSRLRAALAACSPAMARLAMVDAVMEQALAPRERSLLASVPVLLGQHFERERQTAAAQADAPRDDVDPEAWLDVFGQHLRTVLLAELDMRLQPVDGLLEALRMNQPD